MKIEFDPAKSAKNAKERGLPFELTAELDWRAARVWSDERRDYGEERYVAVGSVTCGTQRLILAVVWTPRGRKRRIISAREANVVEQETYRRFCGVL